jgi:hypothetical protein
VSAERRADKNGWTAFGSYHAVRAGIVLFRVSDTRRFGFRRDVVPCWSSGRPAAFPSFHSLMDQWKEHLENECGESDSVRSLGRLDFGRVPTPAGPTSESTLHRQPWPLCPRPRPQGRQSKARWQPFFGFCLFGTNVNSGAWKLVLGENKRCSRFMENR